MERKLTSADLITIGIYTAIYFVLVAVATMATVMILPWLGNLFIPASAALICGTVYMLMVAKLQKFGGISVMGTVMGIFFMLSGHFLLAFMPCIVCGILADLIGKSVNYKNKFVLLISYVVFSYGCLGPVLPMWFMKDAYIDHLLAKGKDSAYIESMLANVNTKTFIILVIVIAVCALIGGLFGQKMVKKHFEKAGIV